MARVYANAADVIPDGTVQNKARGNTMNIPVNYLESTATYTIQKGHIVGISYREMTERKEDMGLWAIRQMLRIVRR